MKLNSDEQTLAENKLLILYILSKVGRSITHKELLELVISISDMNYFYFQQFLLDLIEDKYIFKYEKNNEEIYELTEAGKEALNLTIDLLPGILKLKVDSQFKENFDTIKNKFSISAEYTPITDKDFSINCKIIESGNTIFNIEAYAGSREQAKKMVENWTKNAEKLYPEILNLILDEK
ncbi:MAG: DUF4364 family protein [Candidatus Scatovivens sp.]